MRFKDKVKEIYKMVISAQLPNGLQRLKINRITAAVVILCVCILASIALKTPSFMIGCIISIYLLFIAFGLQYDYINGIITEQVLTCLSTKISKQGSDIVFKDENDKTYVYSYPSKKNTFFENVTYKIYIHKQNKKVIIAYDEI